MEWLWQESIWCPPNFKWADFKEDSAQVADLYYSLLTALLLIALRFLAERLLFRPLARKVLGAPAGPSAKAKTKTPQPGATGGDSTGGAHKSSASRKPPTQVAASASAANQRAVHKFSEGLWRLSFYLLAALYGWFVVLWDKPYFSDTMYAIYDYPDHPVSAEEWWYYNIELGFYISLLITQFVDTKRKDFWQMFVHHIVTILLLALSWACNFHRLGALVLAIHDIADVPLEGAKLAKYCKLQRLADLVFALFTLTWIYTRCYVLPTRVIYYTSYKALSIIPLFPAYYIFNGLLCLLQLLHFAWTWLILRMVFYALQNDGMRDLRSDSEETDDEDSHKD